MRFLVEVGRVEGRRLDGRVRCEGDDGPVSFCGIVELVGVLEAFLDGFQPRQGSVEPDPVREGSTDAAEHADGA